MATNQTEYSWLKQSSVIKFLVAEKCEIYRKMCDVYGEVCFNGKYLYKWTKHGFFYDKFQSKENQWSGNTQSSLYFILPSPSFLASTICFLLHSSWDILFTYYIYCQSCNETFHIFIIMFLYRSISPLISLTPLFLISFSPTFYLHIIYIVYPVM